MSRQVDLELQLNAFVTVRELARYWHVSERTIYRHVEKGAVAVMRVGPSGRLRIRAADALSYGRPGFDAPFEKPDLMPSTATATMQPPRFPADLRPFQSVARRK